VRTLSGRTLTTAAAVVFVLALFGGLMSIHLIAGFNIKGTAEQRIPVFEAGDEEPAVNQPEDDTPKPVLLLPPPTETPPLEPIEMAADPQASEAVEFVLQKPFAEATGRPADSIVPAAKSPWFESPSPENTPALSQEDPAQPSEDPYFDETLLPVPSQTVSFDMPTSTEEMSAQSLPDLVTDTGTFAQPLPPDLSAEEAGTPSQPPPASSGDTTSSPDLQVDTSPFAEDTAYLE
jgi:hypothetical protein